MSIGGTMRTSVSGMNAQAARLGAVSDNIANSNTHGYKQSEVEFSSMILPSTGGIYNSGAVETQIRTLISQQGGLAATGNNVNAQKVDLAVNGNGFFVVGDGNDGNFLTRAGSFTKQSDGTLVNAAGYTLRGYPIGLSGADAVLNGFAGLQDVNFTTGLLSANPTTEGVLTVPLNKDKVTGTKASDTQANAFSVTVPSGQTGAANGDTISFPITIDGGSPITVTVGSATGLAGIQIDKVVDAINALAPNVASSVGGKLVLKSNSTNTGTASSIQLGTVTINSSGTPASTIAGLTSFSAVTGTSAVLPSANGTAVPTADSTITTSITVYNGSGEAVKLDVYYTKTDDVNNKWEVTVFDSRKRSTGTASSPFPYGAAGSTPLATATLDFDDSKYTLATITPSGTTGQTDNKFLNIDLSSIGGGDFKLDISHTTQYTGKTPPLEAKVDGNPAEVIDKVQVGADGVVTALFTSGTQRALYKIPLAKVASPDSLTQVSGNAFSVGIESGTVLMGTGSEGGFGSIVHGSLEESTVDLAGELTTMIEAQRSYTANSKVFQTGSEILDVLVNLKR